ncbi:hypothetical protein LT493_36445 [Streptomyces tricolor]|nr:hypothetical protein [Streptomyces tricolor]
MTDARAPPGPPDRRPAGLELPRPCPARPAPAGGGPRTPLAAPAPTSSACCSWTSATGPCTPTGRRRPTLAVASLRLVAGRHPDDRALAELVGRPVHPERRVHRPCGPGIRVRTCTSGSKSLAPSGGRHPGAGLREPVPARHRGPAPDRRYTAEPGTPSDAALRLLAATAAPAEPGLPALDPR